MRKSSIALLAACIVFASVLPGFCGFVVLDMGGSTTTVDNTTIDSRIDQDHADSNATSGGTRSDVSVTPAGLASIIGSKVPGIDPSLTNDTVVCVNSSGKIGDCSNLTWDGNEMGLNGGILLGGKARIASGENYIVRIADGANASGLKWYYFLTDATNYQYGYLSAGSDYVKVSADSNGTGADNIDVLLSPKGTGVIGNADKSFQVDADGDVTAKSVTATKVANTAGTNTLYNDNDTQTIGFTWKGPHQTTAQTDDFVFQVPTGEPAAGQMMAAGPVASHATTATWITPATLTGAETLTNKTLDGPIVTSKEEDCHADGNLTAAQLSNTIFTNYDQADGNATCILPTAARGMSALFTVATARAKTYGVRAKSTDKIYLLAAAGTISAGDDHGAAVMVNAQVGQQFACYTFRTGASAYDWACKAIAIGTSTFEARPAP